MLDNPIIPNQESDIKPQTEEALVENQDLDLDIEENDIPFEAQELLKPYMKNKTQKRIIELVQDKKDLSNKLSTLESQVQSLMNENTVKKQHAAELEYNSKLHKIQSEKQRALENGEYAKFTDLDTEFVQFVQNTPRPTPQTVDPKEYFKSKNSWYEVDKARTAAAIGEDSKVFSDPSLAHLTQTQKLDLVAERTNALFKNPYNGLPSPTEGANISAPSRQSEVTSEDMRLVSMMYPGRSQSELVKIANEFANKIKKGR